MSVTQNERRKRLRLRLRVPVLLTAESEFPLRTETADISNNGFYCNTMQPFVPGDILACLIELPANSSGAFDSNDRFYLEAKVEVVRIVVNSNSGFGVGCAIREYRVINHQSLPLWASRKAQQEVSEPAAIGQPA
jgi:hypothetical protein